jgi:beta-glucosidase
MKTLLCIGACAVLIAITAVAVRAEDKKASAAQAAEETRPVTCVPAVKDPQRHEQFMKDKEAALKKGPIRLVFIGDSITDAWRGGEQNKIYKERWGEYNPLNLGISGDKTEHVLWRLENGELDGLAGGTKLVTIMIGTNNLGNNPRATPEDTAEGVKAIVRAVREKVPGAKVLLMAVFPRGKAANDPFRAQLQTLNERIAKLDDGKQVKFMDISDVFLDDDGTLPSEVMPDALHPNLKGYQMWADAVGPTIDEMVK